MNSRSFELSDEQRAAVLTPGNLLVRAGAGSGKTEVLAHRFVALLAGDIEGRQPLIPAQVAAITFTEKAACDMRMRIAAVLDKRILAPMDQDRRAHLLRARTLLPLARISTIHAFCARILRENAIQAELDPKFQVLDDYESQTFRDRVCKQGFIDKVRQSDPGACYLARLRRLESAGSREGSVAIVIRILDELTRLGRTPDWLCDATRGSAERIQTQAKHLECLARQLVSLLDDLLAAHGLSPAAERTLAPLRARRDELRQRILAITPDIEPEMVGFLRELCECLPSARGRLRECVSSIKAIVNSSTSRFGLEGELIAAYGACRAMPRALEVAAMVRELGLRLEQAKADEALVTFDDLLLMTRQLLEHSAAVRLRYQTLLRALLVDEFQDTDPIQHVIVAHLTESEGGQAPELFVVGDEKQSIYRFRGANVAGFGRLRKSLCASHGRELPLVGNRRSSPNILAFVNGLGAVLMHAPDSPPYWVQWSSEHVLNALRTPALDSPVEIITAIEDAPPESATSAHGSALPPGAPPKLTAVRKRVREARAIAVRIDQLVGKEIVTDPASRTLRPVRYGDIVLLLRAFTDVAIYEAALLDAAIPCYTIKGRGFFGCQEVLDTIELLTAVDDTADSLALAAALRSPFFGLSDDCLAAIALQSANENDSPAVIAGESFATIFAAGGPAFSGLSVGRHDAIRAWQTLDELRRLHQRGTIVGVLERALEATGYEAVMLGLRQGVQRVANVRKLVDLARDFESRRLFSFHDFVSHLRRLAEQQPYEPPAQVVAESDNVVRLMTVHQAKGLEFPVVILADAGRKPESDSRNPVVDPENGLLIRDASGSGMDEIPNQILAEFRKRSQREQDAESLRLLYVALTRARDRLVISEGAMVQGWAKQIRGFVGDQTYTSFIESENQQQIASCAGAKIMLMKPLSVEALPRTLPPGDSPVDADDLAALLEQRLCFNPPRSTELVLSPTALGDFERCPRQFHFRHYLSLPESPTAGTARQSDASTLGSVAHAVLERLQMDGATEQDIRELTERLGTAAGLDSSDCATIVTDLVRYLPKLALSAPAAREVPFFYHLGDMLFLRGRIDGLIEQGDRVIVRDYKYARAATDAKFYQLPMEAYALAAAEAYPLSRVEAEIVFLKDESIIVPIALPPLAEIRARLVALAGAIMAAQTAGEFPRKPNSPVLCNKLRCGFVQRCWGGG